MILLGVNSLLGLLSNLLGNLAAPFFYLELKEGRLLLEALKSLSLTASCSDAISLAGTGKIRDSGHLCVSSDGLLMAASSPLPPHVEAYIEISLRTFATFSCCRGNRVFRLDLRLLEERIANTVADGLSLCLTAEKAFELLYSLKNSEGNVVHSSPMQLISQYSGVLPGVDWSADSYVVSVQIPALIFRELINNLSTHAPTVQATMTSLEIIFRAADMETVMREEDLSYIILLREGQYPYTFRFTLHQKSAILNAVSLSDRVTLNQLLDSRTVIQIPVEGLGSIQFGFPL